MQQGYSDNSSSAEFVRCVAHTRPGADSTSAVVVVRCVPSTHGASGLAAPLLSCGAWRACAATLGTHLVCWVHLPHKGHRSMATQQHPAEQHRGRSSDRTLGAAQIGDGVGAAAANKGDLGGERCRQLAHLVAGVLTLAFIAAGRVLQTNPVSSGVCRAEGRW